MKYSTEIKTGIIVVVAIGLFIWGYNFLKGSNVLDNQREFYAVYDKVEGLVQSNSVVINGVKVGIIQDIYFHPNNSGKVVVKMVLSDTDFKIPRNTVALITSADLLGTKAMELALGDTIGVYAENGDTLSGQVKASFTDEVNKTVEPIKARAITMLTEIDSILLIIKGVFNEQTQNDITESIENLKKTIVNIESTTADIDTLVTTETSRIRQILDNVNSISRNIKDNNKNITTILNNMASVSDTLARAEIASTISRANKAIAETSDILEKINKGEGSMGMLVNNDSLYNNLNNAAYDLDKLFQDMRKNPGNYVHFSIFGRKNRTQ